MFYVCVKEMFDYIIVVLYKKVKSLGGGLIIFFKCYIVLML